MSVFDFMYQDTATVSRLVSQKQPNGVTKQVLVAVEGMDNLPCRISSETMDKPDDQTETVNPVVVMHKLFCAPQWAFTPGDSITVTHLGKVAEYLAGEAMVYTSHQEVLLWHQDRA